MQTYYDGSCGFLFNDGTIVIAYLEWDEVSNTAHLKENTSIQTIYPKIQINGEYYSYLSPFKVYQSTLNKAYKIFHCTYTNKEQQEKHFIHLSENKKDNWDQTSLIGFVSGPMKKDENNYTVQNVTLDF